MKQSLEVGELRRILLSTRFAWGQKKKSGDSEIFLLKTNGNLWRIFVNWLIYFSICLFSSVGEFQRLVSESTGFIFYGPERFLGCMPPNMLAPMNITGDECVLTMSEWFHARWLDKTKLWSVGFRQWKCPNDGPIYYSLCLARDSPNPDGPLVSIPYPLLYILFAHPNLPIHTHFIWNFYEKNQNCSLFLYLLPGASFVFYNVCVCDQLNKSILTLTLLKGEANVKLLERNRFPLLVKRPLDVIVFSDCHLVILLDLVQTGQSFLRQGKDDATKA